MTDEKTGQMVVGITRLTTSINSDMRELLRAKSSTIRKQFGSLTSHSLFSFFNDQFRAVSRIGNRSGHGSHRWNRIRAASNAQPSFSLFSFSPINRPSIPEVLTRAAALSTDIYSDMIRT